MSAISGMSVIGTYGTNGSVGDDIDTLLALIPNPDAPHGTGAVADLANHGVNNSFLDEMNPAAAAQLRVELTAIKASTPFASGQYVVTAGDVTATHADIVTGLDDLTLANCSFTVRRAGTNVTADAVFSEPAAGTIRVADGAVTYVLTAGDVVTWSAR